MYTRLTLAGTVLLGKRKIIETLRNGGPVVQLPQGNDPSTISNDCFKMS